MSQEKAILNVLEANGEGFLVARRLDGRWSVEVAGGAEHVGESITDALGQATQTIALTKGIDPDVPSVNGVEPIDVDERWTLEPPLEFCSHYVVSNDAPERALRALEVLDRKAG